MSNNGWDLIDFNTCSSMTINKYKSAFQKTTNVNRKLCFENFKKHLRLTLHDPNKKVNAGCLYPYEIVKGVVCSMTAFDKMLCDAQWKNHMISHKHDKKSLNKVIPIIDMSYEMEEDGNVPLYSAIGLGIACSEKLNDRFRNNVITFSSNASMINLNDCTTFCTKVYKIITSKTKSRESNVYSAIKLVAKSILENNLKNYEIRAMRLVIFSNMRFCGSNFHLKTFSENVIDIFKTYNLNEIPQIILWNVGKPDGDCCFSYQYNYTMLSGHNSNLLNFVYSNKNHLPTHNCVGVVDSYYGVQNILNHSRYKIVDIIISNYLKGL